MRGRQGRREGGKEGGGGLKWAQIVCSQPRLHVAAALLSRFEPRGARTFLATEIQREAASFAKFVPLFPLLLYTHASHY